MSLFKSMEKGDLKGLLKRIKSGTSFTLLNDIGQTRLHRAIELGDVSIVAALVNAGAPLDAARNGGYLDTVELLLEGCVDSQLASRRRDRRLPA